MCAGQPEDSRLETGRGLSHAKCVTAVDPWIRDPCLDLRRLCEPGCWARMGARAIHAWS